MSDTRRLELAVEPAPWDHGIRQHFEALGRVIGAAGDDADAASARDHVDAIAGIEQALAALLKAGIADAFHCQECLRRTVDKIGAFGYRAAALLAQWAALCAASPEMFSRPQLESGEVPPGMDGDLARGLRRATDAEAVQLANAQALMLRRAAGHYVAAAAAAEDLLGSMLPFRHPDEPVRTRTTLYFAYDDEGVLLYIGITGNHEIRRAAHAKRSSWYAFRASERTEEYPDREEAEEAERNAIGELKPLFNHTHNDTPEARERLVAYLVKRGRLDLLAPVVSRG